MLKLGEIVANNAKYKKDAPAYVELQRNVNWGQVHERTDAIGHVLRSLGLRRGDRIGFLARDCIETVETLIICAKVGAIRVGLNHRYAPLELAQLIDDSGIDYLFVHADYVELAQKALSQSKRIPKMIGIGPAHNLEYDYEEMIAGGLAQGDLVQSPHDILMICYTTGTTGAPKGALYPHEKMMESVASIALCEGARSDDVWLHVMPASGVPIFHMLRPIFHGGKCVIVDEWNVEKVLTLIERERCTMTVMVPTMLTSLLESGLVSKYDCSSIRQINYGAAPMPPAAIKNALKVFGCRFVQLYGSTELMGMVCMLMHEDHLRGINEDHACLASVGRPLYHTQVRIVDDSGNDVPIGKAGELIVKTEFVVPGFWNQNIKYAEIVNEGWLRTGDIAVQDEEGYIYMKDRANFRIKSGGYNIFPIEIENCIAEHPAISNVAVFGIPDEKWGERVQCVVTVFPGMSVTENEIKQFCRDRISSFKIPKVVQVWDALPMGATGKILKRRIIEMCMEQEECHTAAEAEGSVL